MKDNLKTKFSSRQYMNSKDFELYYYAEFSPNSVKSHTHDYYEFYFFLEGDLSLSISDEMHKIKSGDFLLIPPRTEHYPIIHNNKGAYRRFILWISADYFDSLLKESKDYVYLMRHVLKTHNYVFSNDIIEFNAICSKLFRLIEEMQSERFGKETGIYLELKSFIFYLNRLVFERTQVESANRTNQSLYMSLCEYISEHLNEDLSLEILANKFYMSKSYISHEFKDNIGISIHQYITKKRLNASKDGLLSDIPISRIYEKYGFNDYSAYFRAFKKEYGMSPKEYRKMHEQDFNE